MMSFSPQISRSPGSPPPLWLVAHGGAVVGPVSTNRLVRGVLAGKVPSASLVRERTWCFWRNVERIREVAALRRQQAVHGDVHVPRTRFGERPPAAPPIDEALQRRLRWAVDPGEVLLLALTEMMRVTGASVGAVYRARAPFIGLVTSCVSGPGMYARLGHVLPGGDPAFLHAAEGRDLYEPADASSQARIIRDRLGGLPASAGVAMLPLTIAGRVYAMAELGRADHPFRGADQVHLRGVLDATSDRLAVIRNP